MCSTLCSLIAVRVLLWWLGNLALALLYFLHVFLSLHLWCLFSTLLQFITYLLSVSFPLFNLLLSVLDSVIGVLKQALSSPLFSLCLSQFPSLLISTLQRCFLGEHLLFSLVLLPLPPSSPALSQSLCFLHACLRAFVHVLLHYAAEGPFSCQYHLITPLCWKQKLQKIKMSF